MQIVIDISEERFRDIQRIAEVQLERNHFKTAEQIIANATPLPKGHGRIGDLDVLRDAYHTNDYDFYEALDDTDTIIEADKQYKTEVITRGNCMICGKALTEGLFLCKECGDKANGRK